MMVRDFEAVTAAMEGMVSYSAPHGPYRLAAEQLARICASSVLGALCV